MIKISDKTIKQPYVTVNGEWRTVKKESVLVNGSWQTVFDKSYQIKLYRYGELYTTLYCPVGSSIQLVTVPTVQSADLSHYGWTKTVGSTSRNYTATATITPTGNMELYAVFSYSETTYTTAYTTSTAKTITLPMAGTITVGGAIRTVSYSTSGGATTTNNDITLNSGATAPYCKVGTSYVSGTSAKQTFYADYSNNIYFYAVATKTVVEGTSITMLGKTASSSSGGSGYSSDYYVAVKYPSGSTTKYRSKI